MSNLTQDTAIRNQRNELETTISRENYTETTVEHQAELLESSPMLTSQTNNETVSLAMQNIAGEDNVSDNSTSSSNKEGICAAARDIAKCLAFILYITDIVSDISVSYDSISRGNIGYGCLILFFVYLASFLNATNSESDFDIDFQILMIIIFNLSGVLLYGKIIYLLYRKWSKKPYCKDTLNLTLEDLNVTIFWEGILEGFPQILIQTCLISESIIANEHISWFRYTSLAISTLGITTSIIRYVQIYAEFTWNNITFDKVIDSLWGLFLAGLISLIVLTTAAAAVSSGTIYFCIIPFTIFMLIFILGLKTNFLGFISIGCVSCNLDLEQTIRIHIGIGIILITFIWYFTQNAVLWYWPLTFDYINYLSIAYFVLGLVVIILKIVQIIIMYLKKIFIK